MGNDLTDPGADLSENRHAQLRVLYDPATDASDGLYPGISDNVRVWPGAEGVEATLVRFVNHRFSPHTHDSLMLGLIESGSKEFQRERRTYVAHPGLISVVNPGELHTGYRLSGAELRYRALYIPTELLADSSDRANVEIAFRSAIIEDMSVYGDLLRAHNAIIREESRLIQDDLLLLALSALALRHGDRPGAHRGRGRAIARREVANARSLIDSLYAEELPIASIAQSVGLSPFHLMREFRQHVGIPMHAYQLQIRVGRAKRLLAAGWRPSQVALEVGFSDQSHFTRRFKSIVGASPASYRRDACVSCRRVRIPLTARSSNVQKN